MAYQLKNELLAVDIADPGEYRGTRFDWSGFITGVRFASHTFCVPESLVPGQGTGGIGLCSEFGIAQTIGYDEAESGGKFPKLGVGLLTRPDEAPYQFFRDYEAEPFSIMTEQQGTQSVTFTVLPKECNGYAVQLVKTVSIDHDRLIVSVEMDNVGTRPVHTDEYCHNFFGIDGEPIGPDYVLRFPFAPSPWSDDPGTLNGLAFSGNEVTWERQPEKDFYFRLPGVDGAEQPWLWELVHRPSGLGVRERSKLRVAAAAVWGKGHVVSPEMFVEVKLAPGERQTWTRVYEFFETM
ncbi:hypothetical protein NYE69_12180 [Paenibacillus sp. FSL R5-0527]|uniref:hypothetical protein n=1 Tax=Paenibacillus sp. FSL R5-0527 TaxID=2975321 RepID=UPI00097A8A89|nr:hypothetical protein BK140_30980 [Paenibacillus macerans]